jgi:hypothetical protein
MPRTGRNLIGPVGEKDDLDVRELLETAERLARDVLGEFDGAHDVVPVVVERLTALVAYVGDWSNAVVHDINLPSGEIDAELEHGLRTDST